MLKRSRRTGMSPAIEPLEGRMLLAARPRLSIVPDVPAGYSIDGKGNNLANPSWGSAGIVLTRRAPAAYSDQVSSPSGATRPGARMISNTIFDQPDRDRGNARMLSAMAYAWGQFIDHDIDLTPAGGRESLSIPVPASDPSFDPDATGTKVIRTTRSSFDGSTGTSIENPRQQINRITAWLDGSMIYGSDPRTAGDLRSHVRGMMKTSPGGLLPFNDSSYFPGVTPAMVNDAHRVPDDQLFATGDVRANENIELTALQTLFVREHNNWAARIATGNRSLDDEQVYQRARAIVIAEIQAITYNDWLPALLGRGALRPYRGYDASVDPGIINEFSTAAFRFGHSLLGEDVKFLGNDGLPTMEEVPLSEALSNPPLLREAGIDPILKYLASDPSSELDIHVVDSVRNFLFGEPGSGGLDLVSLNIERGRDHGLADYNTIRAVYGLPRVAGFGWITTDVDEQAKLRELYGSVGNIDAWVGMLAEDHVPGASVGPTIRAVVSDQFERIRDGDRFWYQRVYSGRILRQIEATRLYDVIRRNTGISSLQGDVFFFRAGISGAVALATGEARRDRNAAGQSVELVDAQKGHVVTVATTDAKGRFAFDVRGGLRTGRYEVWLRRPLGKSEAVSHSLAITRGDQFIRGVSLRTITPGQAEKRRWSGAPVA